MIVVPLTNTFIGTVTTPPEGYERTRSLPLSVALKDMSYEERLAFSPTDVDPLEVWNALPDKWQKAFGEDASVHENLLKLQAKEDPVVFSYYIGRCVDCGLWQPTGDVFDGVSESDSE